MGFVDLWVAGGGETASLSHQNEEAPTHVAKLSKANAVDSIHEES